MAEKSEQLMGKEELDALWAKIKNTFFASASFTQANIQSTLGISNWALASSKPSYAFSEITGTASSSQIPTLAISKIDGLQTALNNKLETSLKGAAYGLAELDANGLVPASQLPSYVDDVLEYASTTVFPSTGVSGKIYVALDTNLTYRWSGTTYVEISPSLALGETSSTAYRGDRGKVAYDHSQSTHARTDATAVASSTTNGNIKINGTETTVYSLPTATASVLGGIKVGTGLGISSGVLSVSYGTTATTACAGNDSRLSDARTPVAHASTGTGYGVGTTANYGHVKLATGDMNGASGADGVACGKNHTHSQYYLATNPNGYTTNTGTVTKVSTGTGLTGGDITTTGTISINSTYQTYISHGESAYNSLGNYLPLAGGTMTGAIKRNYASASTDPVVTVSSNNQDVWLWRVSSGNPTYATSADYGFGLMYKGTGSDNNNNLILYADNQAGTQVASMTIKQDGSVSFNSTPTVGTTAVSLSGHTHSYAGSSSAGGAATSANKLNTDAGSATNPVYFSGGVPVACTYSLNKTVPSDAVFTDHTYNFSGTTFYSGNSSNAEHNANNAVKNGNYYYSSNGPATSLGASTNDGALYVQSYSDSWVGQIAQDYRNGRLFVRGKNNGTWQNWLRVALYSEIPTNNNQLTNGAGYITSAGSCAYATSAGDADTLDGQHGSYYQPKVSAKGSTTKPVYTSAAGTFAECSTYAGGTAVTLNGTSKAASTASFYAPTGAGTSGQILKSTAGTPEWINQSAITAGKATTLETTRTIWGQNFNGSANVSGNMTGVGSIAASGDVHTTASVIGDKGVSSKGIANLSVAAISGSNFVTQVKIGSTAYNPSDGVVSLPAYPTVPTALSGFTNDVGYLSGTVAVANGGTGATTASAARTNLGLGSVATLNTGSDTTKFLRNDGSWAVPAYPTVPTFSSLTLSTTAQKYDGTHTLALPASDPYSSARTPSAHATNSTTYGAGTTTNYGHVKLVTGDMNGATNTDGEACSKNHTHSQYLTSHQSVVNGGNTASWGASVTVGTVGGTALTFTMPANPNTDTKNTTGADNTTSNIYLVGPTSQTSSNGNARTYSNSECYASGGYLYSKGKIVANRMETPQPQSGSATITLNGTEVPSYQMFDINSTSYLTKTLNHPSSYSAQSGFSYILISNSTSSEATINMPSGCIAPASSFKIGAGKSVEVSYFYNGNNVAVIMWSTALQAIS